MGNPSAVSPFIGTSKLPAKFKSRFVYVISENVNQEDWAVAITVFVSSYTV